MMALGSVVVPRSTLLCCSSPDTMVTAALKSHEDGGGGDGSVRGQRWTMPGMLLKRPLATVTRPLIRACTSYSLDDSHKKHSAQFGGIS